MNHRSIQGSAHTEPFLFGTPECKKTAKTWVEINENRFFSNINQIKTTLKPTTKVVPVIKSNAYGHGIKEIAYLCQKYHHIDWVAVAMLSEALLLRSQGITKPILVLSIFDEPLETIIEHDLRVVAHDFEQLYALNALGKRHNHIIFVHIKIDTGLSRGGIMWYKYKELYATVQELPFLHVEGLCTHFAQSESHDQTFTKLQQNRLLNVYKTFPFHITYLHAASSAGSLLDPYYQGNLVRPGISIYGLWPSQASHSLIQQQHPTINFAPVLTWKTTIMHVKELPVGSRVGYNGTFTTQRLTKIATLPIGYWDGYDRKLSNCGIVKIDKHYAPVIGAVAMNLTTIDVTNIPSSALKNDVILLGDHAPIHADTLAAKIGTINYEITTRINPLIKRCLIAQ